MSLNVAESPRSMQLPSAAARNSDRAVAFPSPNACALPFSESLDHLHQEKFDETSRAFSDCAAGLGRIAGVGCRQRGRADHSSMVRRGHPVTFGVGGPVSYTHLRAHET